MPLFIYVRPSKTGTESLTSYLGDVFNFSHSVKNAACPMCDVWTNVPSLRLRRPHELPCGLSHCPLPQLCEAAQPLSCSRMLTFTVARSPWEREVSAFIFEARKNLCNGTDEEVACTGSKRKC